MIVRHPQGPHHAGRIWSGPRPATDHLPVSGTPAAPVADRARIDVAAKGFQPGEPLLVARCAGFPQAGVVEACEPLDPSAALVAIMGRSTKDVHQFAAADSTFVVSI